jgi:hypothetical protein
MTQAEGEPLVNGPNAAAIPIPLLGIQKKLERAQAHLDALGDEFDRAFDGRSGDPVGMTKELHRDPDGKTGYFSIRVAHVKEPPIEVGVKIGEIVHNLRSALDHLAWQLGRLNREGQRPHRGTAFPICRTRPYFESKPTRDTLKHIHPDHRTLIEECQPYHGGDLGLLAFLSDLSRSDKHQVVNTAQAAQGDFALSIKASSDCTLRRDGLRISMDAGKPMEVDVEVAQAPIFVEGPKPDIEVEAEGSIYVAFENGAEIFQTMGNIGHVVERVVRRFIPVFDTPEGRKLSMGTEDGLHDWPLGFQELTIRALDAERNVLGEGSAVLDEAAEAEKHPE